jgi:hypothetical protein
LLGQRIPRKLIMDLISAGARKLDGIEDGREDIAITEGGS